MRKQQNNNNPHGRLRGNNNNNNAATNSTRGGTTNTNQTNTGGHFYQNSYAAFQQHYQQQAAYQHQFFHQQFGNMHAGFQNGAGKGAAGGNNKGAPGGGFMPGAAFGFGGAVPGNNKKGGANNAQNYLPSFFASLNSSLLPALLANERYTWYVLGLDKLGQDKATKVNITLAFRQLSLQLHPDQHVGENKDEFWNYEFGLINEARTKMVANLEKKGRATDKYWCVEVKPGWKRPALVEKWAKSATPVAGNKDKDNGATGNNNNKTGTGAAGAPGGRGGTTGGLQRSNSAPMFDSTNLNKAAAAAAAANQANQQQTNQKPFQPPRRSPREEKQKASNKEIPVGLTPRFPAKGGSKKLFEDSGFTFTSNAGGGSTSSSSSSSTAKQMNPQNVVGENKPQANIKAAGNNSSKQPSPAQSSTTSKRGTTKGRTKKTTAAGEETSQKETTSKRGHNVKKGKSGFQPLSMSALERRRKEEAMRSPSFKQVQEDYKDSKISWVKKAGTKASAGDKDKNTGGGNSSVLKQNNKSNTSAKTPAKTGGRGQKNTSTTRNNAGAAQAQQKQAEQQEDENMNDGDSTPEIVGVKEGSKGSFFSVLNNQKSNLFQGRGAAPSGSSSSSASSSSAAGISDSNVVVQKSTTTSMYPSPSPRPVQEQSFSDDRNAAARSTSGATLFRNHSNPEQLKKLAQQQENIFKDGITTNQAGGTSTTLTTTLPGAPARKGRWVDILSGGTHFLGEKLMGLRKHITPGDPQLPSPRDQEDVDMAAGGQEKGRLYPIVKTPKQSEVMMPLYRNKDLLDNAAGTGIPTAGRGAAQRVLFPAKEKEKVNQENNHTENVESSTNPKQHTVVIDLVDSSSQADKKSGGFAPNRRTKDVVVIEDDSEVVELDSSQNPTPASEAGSAHANFPARGGTAGQKPRIPGFPGAQAQQVVAGQATGGQQQVVDSNAEVEQEHNKDKQGGMANFVFDRLSSSLFSTSARMFGGSLGTPRNTTVDTSIVDDNVIGGDSTIKFYQEDLNHSKLVNDGTDPHPKKLQNLRRMGSSLDNENTSNAGATSSVKTNIFKRGGTVNNVLGGGSAPGAADQSNNMGDAAADPANNIKRTKVVNTLLIGNTNPSQSRSRAGGQGPALRKTISALGVIDEETPSSGAGNNVESQKVNELSSATTPSFAAPNLFMPRSGGNYNRDLQSRAGGSAGAITSASVPIPPPDRVQQVQLNANSTTGLFSNRSLFGGKQDNLLGHKVSASTATGAAGAGVVSTTCSEQEPDHVMQKEKQKHQNHDPPQPQLDRRKNVSSKGKTLDASGLFDDPGLLFAGMVGNESSSLDAVGSNLLAPGPGRATTVTGEVRSSSSASSSASSASSSSGMNNNHDSARTSSNKQPRNSTVLAAPLQDIQLDRSQAPLRKRRASVVNNNGLEEEGHLMEENNLESGFTGTEGVPRIIFEQQPAGTGSKNAVVRTSNAEDNPGRGQELHKPGPNSRSSPPHQNLFQEQNPSGGPPLRGTFSLPQQGGQQMERNQHSIPFRRNSTNPSPRGPVVDHGYSSHNSVASTGTATASNSLPKNRFNRAALSGGAATVPVPPPAGHLRGAPPPARIQQVGGNPLQQDEQDVILEQASNLKKRRTSGEFGPKVGMVRQGEQQAPSRTLMSGEQASGFVVDKNHVDKNAPPSTGLLEEPHQQTMHQEQKRSTEKDSKPNKKSSVIFGGHSVQPEDRRRTASNSVDSLESAFQNGKMNKEIQGDLHGGSTAGGKNQNAGGSGANSPVMPMKGLDDIEQPAVEKNRSVASAFAGAGPGAGGIAAAVAAAMNPRQQEQAQGRVHEPPPAYNSFPHGQQLPAHEPEDVLFPNIVRSSPIPGTVSLKLPKVTSKGTAAEVENVEVQRGQQQFQAPSALQAQQNKIFQKPPLNISSDDSFFAVDREPPFAPTKAGVPSNEQKQQQVNPSSVPGVQQLPSAPPQQEAAQQHQQSGHALPPSVSDNQTPRLSTLGTAEPVRNLFGRPSLAAPAGGNAGNQQAEPPSEDLDVEMLDASLSENSNKNDGQNVLLQGQGIKGSHGLRFSANNPPPVFNVPAVSEQNNYNDNRMSMASAGGSLFQASSPPPRAHGNSGGGTMGLIGWQQQQHQQQSTRPLASSIAAPSVVLAGAPGGGSSSSSGVIIGSAGVVPAAVVGGQEIAPSMSATSSSGGMFTSVASGAPSNMSTHATGTGQGTRENASTNRPNSSSSTSFNTDLLSALTEAEVQDNARQNARAGGSSPDQDAQLSNLFSGASLGGSRPLPPAPAAAAMPNLGSANNQQQPLNQNQPSAILPTVLRLEQIRELFQLQRVCTSETVQNKIAESLKQVIVTLRQRKHRDAMCSELFPEHVAAAAGGTTSNSQNKGIEHVARLRPDVFRFYSDGRRERCRLLG
ncbi:unnamed protein product [Amoebophrya sp. A120]|nr:unnamed protein product [Amoebophrya sp. A120]|eukprot:GSA120T00016524001.1